MPMWIQAGLWGLIAGVALLIGAAAGCFLRLPTRLIAAVTAFGSGVLISALAFELMEVAYQSGGFFSTAVGFLSGAAVFTAANWALAFYGAKHRKRSGSQQPSETEQEGSGLAIAVGSLLDGIPESIVIGVSLLQGSGVSLVAVIAVFLSNLPEGLSSAVGMQRSGRSLRYIFSIWGGLVILSSAAAMIGYVVFGQFSQEIIAATTAVAAGAILAMIVDTMIPEAFEVAHDFAGLITVVGFLTSFALSKLGG